jgi:nickel-dependent lactate racemase
MKVNEVTVPSLAWAGDEKLTISFPLEWEVIRCKMACEGYPGMSKKEIKTSISNPIGTSKLEKLAENAEEVVIIIDDMTRPTKSYQFAKPVLGILHEANISKDNIRFIISPGTHGTFGRLDFVKKLGEEIVDEYQCYNHNPYEMLDYLGETSYGTPVYINSEVMRCDLKIGIGTVLFHRLMGMSGGGKIISPGVAGIKTIRHNHGPLGGFGPDLTPHKSTGYMMNDGNIMRLDAEETARIAGLDFKIDSVLNLERDPIEVYAGDFVETQRRASAGALKWHRYESPEADIVVVNSYMRGNEPYLGFWPAFNSVTHDGTVVLIAMDPDGDINHWLFNHHGKFTGSSLWPGKPQQLAKGARLIVHGPHYKSLEMRLGPPKTTTWIKEWNDVIEELKKHHGPGARVAVLPDGTSGIPEKAIDKM